MYFFYEKKEEGEVKGSSLLDQVAIFALVISNYRAFVNGLGLTISRCKWKVCIESSQKKVMERS